jgi:ketosteroid isomerase-like protein
VGVDTEQVVRSIYAGWNDDDFEAVARRLHPDVVWRPSRVLPGLDPVYHGQDGVRRFWDGMKSSWDDVAVSIERAVVNDDLAVVTIRFEGVERRSGKRFAVPFTHAWHCEGGLVTRCSTFAGEEEALMRAAELG